MKKLLNWQILLSLLLITLAFGFYALDYFLFGQLKDIIFYSLIDIAFLFLSGLIVMLFLHRLLEYREKQSLFKKLNMVIGAFFSEAGIELLRQCSGYECAQENIYRELLITGGWTEKDFLAAKKKISGSALQVKCGPEDLEKLKVLLMSKQAFLIGLLGNPNLLEHEAFTDLLWAVFHLADELAHRNTLRDLPGSDYKHLFGDIDRAYSRLIIQWLDHMNHLKNDYPYLFSLALRTNPFDKKAEVTIYKN